MFELIYLSILVAGFGGGTIKLFLKNRRFTREIIKKMEARLFLCSILKHY